MLAPFAYEKCMWCSVGCGGGYLYGLRCRVGLDWHVDLVCVIWIWFGLFFDDPYWKSGAKLQAVVLKSHFSLSENVKSQVLLVLHKSENYFTGGGGLLLVRHHQSGGKFRSYKFAYMHTPTITGLHGAWGGRKRAEIHLEKTSSTQWFVRKISH